MLKAKPFYAGPKGGKWADPALSIPWKDTGDQGHFGKHEGLGHARHANIHQNHADNAKKEGNEKAHKYHASVADYHRHSANSDPKEAKNHQDKAQKMLGGKEGESKKKPAKKKSVHFTKLDEKGHKESMDKYSKISQKHAKSGDKQRERYFNQASDYHRAKAAGDHKMADSHKEMAKNIARGKGGSRPEKESAADEEKRLRREARSDYNKDNKKRRDNLKKLTDELKATKMALEILENKGKKGADSDDKHPLSYKESFTENGKTFETGKPVEINFKRFKWKQKQTAGEGDRFQQKIEPAGQYMNHDSGHGGELKETDRFKEESGKIKFNNPLVIPFSSDGQDNYNESSWKMNLAKHYKTKTPKALSTKLKADGYDGIVTVQQIRGQAYTSEIISLKSDRVSKAREEGPMLNEVIKRAVGVIQKARVRKYIRREGSKGKYKYWYLDPKTGKEYTGKKPEVGTHHEKDAQKFVKHEDGWVHIGGYNHGKLKGKKESTKEHKEFAKKEYEKMYPSKEAKKEKPKKDKPTAEEKKEPVDTSEIEGEARKEAKKETERMKDEEYAFARDSKFQNQGEDLMESARHKRNAWKGLDDAEAKGMADELVNRKNLLKNDPPDILSKLDKDNVDSALYINFAIKKFPSEPLYPNWISKMKNSDKISSRKSVQRNIEYNLFGSGVKEDEAVETVTVGEYKKRIRKIYLEAYEDVKETGETMLEDGQDDMELMSNSFKALSKNFLAEMRKFDGYNPTYDKFRAYHNTALAHGVYGSANSAYTSVSKFRKNAEKTFPDDSNVWTSDEYVENAKKVVEGKTVDAVWGASKEIKRKKKFGRAELYITNKASREGPKVKGTGNYKTASKVMSKELGMRGIQHGNSVLDDERVHHMKQAAMAFSDLTDILGLPKGMASFNGRLGIAFGARGKGGAMAHYEPWSKIINLTRKNGVGTLAHEWGHFFDNVVSEIHGQKNTRDSKGKIGAAFSSEDASRHFLMDKTGQWVDRKRNSLESSFKDLMTSDVMVTFKEKVRDRVREMSRQGFSMKPNYWTSGREIFARCFENYVDHKLKKSDRVNTYLSQGMTDEFWPDKAEMKKMAPLFDKVFKEFGKSDLVKKALVLMGLDTRKLLLTNISHLVKNLDVS